MSMQVIYEGKDIAPIVEIKRADIIDNAGGVADSLELHFNDPDKLWGEWSPMKNDSVQVVENGFTSGLMYVDELEQQRGIFIVRALSIPQESKTANTKAWENVRFLEIATEIAGKYGYSLETYGIENHLYERVDQLETADFKFLALRCMLEGYMIKITDRKVVIYDELYMESLDAKKNIDISDFDGNYKFLQKATGIFRSSKITYGSIQSEFTPNNASSGPILKFTDLQVFSQGEADRYARKTLRCHNKYETIGHGTIQLDTGIAAGINININGVGLAKGKYFCDQAIHSLVGKKTLLKLRKPLEGY